MGLVDLFEGRRRRPRVEEKGGEGRGGEGKEGDGRKRIRG